MSRISWFDDDTDLPVIDEQVEKLEHFAQSMADGMITTAELEQQQSALVNVMRDVEDELNDSQHAKVTRLLVELSAYNVMRLLNELQSERLKHHFK